MHAELRWFAFHTLQRRSPQPGDRSRYAAKAVRLSDNPYAAPKTINSDASRASAAIWLHASFAVLGVVAVEFSLQRFLGWLPPVLLVPAILYVTKIACLSLLPDKRILAISVFAAVATATITIPMTRECGNPHITWLGLWVCTPVIFLAVPTASLAIDLGNGFRPQPVGHIWRSFAELVIICPVWFYISAFVSLALGGWWI